jgi:hypothetical protein
MLLLLLLLLASRPVIVNLPVLCLSNAPSWIVILRNPPMEGQLAERQTCEE